MIKQEVKIKNKYAVSKRNNVVCESLVVLSLDEVCKFSLKKIRTLELNHEPNFF